jgi:hypothetical protein
VAGAHRLRGAQSLEAPHRPIATLQLLMITLDPLLGRLASVVDDLWQQVLSG